MKFKVQDINELSDSREILESKPHSFTYILIYIILALIAAALTWSWFSEKEIVVKGSGIVRPNEDILKVSNLVTSRITEIKAENGQKVKEGDILYVLDSKDMENQKKSIEDKINLTKQEIDNLNKLKSSINDGKNYFDSSNDKEKDYYNKYLNYEKGNMIISDTDGIIEKKNTINSKINSFNLLKKSIMDEKNYCEANSVYSDQYNSYVIAQKDIKDRLKQSEELYSSLSKNENTNKEEVNKLSSDINSYKLQLERLKNEYTLKISSTIEELNVSLKELVGNSEKINSSNNLSKDKNKSTALVQIGDSIKQQEIALKDLEDNLKQVNTNIERCAIKATKGGTLDINTNLNIGDVIQGGITLATILPDTEQYKIDISILDKDIATLKDGQEVKYNFPALPSREYGFINGKLSKISADSKVSSQNGMVYYTAEGEITKTKVLSHQGEEAKIKTGMTCEVQIVTRRQKMLYYILEKLSLKD